MYEPEYATHCTVYIKGIPSDLRHKYSLLLPQPLEIQGVSNNNADTDLISSAAILISLAVQLAARWYIMLCTQESVSYRQEKETQSSPISL